MDTGLILKVAGVGLLVTAVCHVLARSGRDEQAMLVSVAGVVIVMVLLVDRISELIGSLRAVFGI